LFHLVNPVRFCFTQVGNFVLELESTANVEFLRISDIIGRPILERNIDKKKLDINIKFLEAGIYFITIYGKGGVETVQLLKQ
jgi:hypothetical protein